MFIVLPVGMNYRTERLPLVTLALIGINTLVYLVSLFFFFQTGGRSEAWIYQHLWLIPAQSFWWTYLTSMFVHGGFFHLLGNMIFLFLFGACVEDFIGRWKFLSFYLIGGFVAELVFVAMSPEHFASMIPMGGASGAISACMGMYLLLRASAEIEFKYFLWFFFYVKAGEFEIPAWVAIGFWFLNNLVWAVVGMTQEHDTGGVAFGDHVGGLLAGLAMIWICRQIDRRRDRKQMETDQPHLIIEPAEIFAVAPAPAAGGETPAIFLYDGQEQTGPFTLTQVQQKLRHGEIGRDAQYWSEGMTEWENVLELAGRPLE